MTSLGTELGKNGSSPTMENTPDFVNNPSDNDFLMYRALMNLCTNNADFFENDESENGQRLCEAFKALREHVTNIQPHVEQVRRFAPEYDYDEKVPGNGYRSFLSVVDCAITHGVQLSRKICLRRDSVIFRKGFFMREVEACSHLLASLTTCLQHLCTLSKWCDRGELFPSENHSPEELLSTADDINQYCFYGRCLGFQYCTSMRGILKFISLCMASFSEVYYNRGSLLSKATSSMWISGRYLLDPELRARRIVNISQHASVDFCKAFWFLAESELMTRVPSVMATSVAVNKIISIPPEPLTFTKADGTVVDIEVPTAHIGPAPVQVRLISSVVRQGMVGEAANSSVNAEPSNNLIIHCHGGGFVAQSSKSHEVYLRQWASWLNAPILSIDYSLAPAAPFPRAHQEVLYAYVWALKNCELLGSTAKNVVFAGDSAGANLMLGLAMKCIEMDIRQPNGLFMAYVPVLVSFVPSPARLLCLMDPLLPFGFMMRCLKAYASPSRAHQANGHITPRNDGNGTLSNSDTESFEEVSESDLADLQAHKSPASEVSDTLTNVSLSSQQSVTSKQSSYGHLTITSDTTETAKEVQEGTLNADMSQKYVSEFDTYVNEIECDSGPESMKSEEQTFRNRLSKFMGSITSTFSSWAGNVAGPSDAEAVLNLNAEYQKSAKDEFKFEVPRDPYLSPYWASDEIAKKLPPIRIVTIQLDPCLDDCVMFAKKMKRLGNNVNLDILYGLPHGFLNFCLLSKEAYEGSKKCVKHISELLDLSNEEKH